MRTLSTLALCLTFFAVSSYACECGDKKERPNKDEIVKKFDANGDGTLDEAERATARTAMEAKVAAKVAANVEAKKGEHMAQMKEKHPELFAKIDTNGDGTIDQNEREAAKAHFLEQHPNADGNGDGNIDHCEREAIKGKIAERREQGNNGQRDHGEGVGAGKGKGKGNGRAAVE